MSNSDSNSPQFSTALSEEGTTSSNCNLSFGIQTILDGSLKMKKEPRVGNDDVSSPFLTYPSIFYQKLPCWQPSISPFFPTIPKILPTLPYASLSNQDDNRREKRPGHPYQNRAPAKHKKPRTSFTKAQVALLETKFLDRKYLASSERAILANQLHMSDAQVKTWFQNRRTKWRRQESEEREYEGKETAKMLSFTAQCLLIPPNLNRP